ncbi:MULTISPECIES: MAE_28990/MAE_18760 family HEPN-like nuclease [Vibrio]|uniref:MAE_28990/MAE_18760 family HEPN-like nuclease n=1 Tax=Vibrio TaxID=662 RepID=UPI0005AC1DB6|nr:MULTISPECIES: MAE_28990/MAE_18760 family HEPN-like nuclease [Vibrio]KIP66817.1 hypothetical protein SN12_22180 [Vibrio alginolyticus]KIP83074.1 hypothetical protein SN13_11640 [Vibrio alginolyticus]MDW1794104.1 MAE_28990/MAE_18760 family HEPN-like nuclease [Vibrio sp. Vb2297]MDW1855921.1 MAE_28990/MAE_18760 family HEPN-like nuclease [Vibrio sp. Vb0974]MDW2049865.1 MAE_28990/MAE_18760 family HEPN-like nuclease [Vibrio sp. 977]
MNEYILEARVLLKERAKEVNSHLSFVQALIDSKANSLARRAHDGEIIFSEHKIDRRLVKTLSATGYLLIYNLIESVMTDALDAVHKQLQSDELTFSQLSDELKKICLRDFNKSTVNQKHLLEHGEISLDKALTWLGYSRFNHFNGNIDAKTIQKKARSYGFSIADHDRKFTNDGQILRDIRDKRNSLAHGEVSFEECGQDTAIESLIVLNEQACMYLSAVLDGVDHFLTKKRYRNVEEG